MNVLAMVTTSDGEDGRIGFEIAPNDLYPPMFAHIQSVVNGSQEPENQTIRSQYYPLARQLPSNAWDMALQPATEDLSPANREVRAVALECARSWFTELLHAAIEYRPMHLRITKDEAYRL